VVVKWVFNMSNITKVCTKHGLLSEEDINVKNMRCRICQREWSKSNYEKNKEKILIRQMKSGLVWRSNNKDKVKRMNKKYWDKGVKELRNNYIKDSLCRNTNLKISELPSDLVDAYRNVLSLKRKVKELSDDS
jgi:hypothetical protein